MIAPTAPAPRPPAARSRSSTVRTPEEERRYHLAFARLIRERGFSALARSHELLAGAYLSEEERRANLARSRVAAGSWGERADWE